MSVPTWIAALAAVLVLAPGAVAASGGDARFDEQTTVGVFVPADVCHHGAIDLTSTSAIVEDDHLVLEQTVRDAAGAWRCGGVSQGVSETRQVSVQLRAGHVGPTVTAWDRATSGLSTSSGERCYEVNFAVTVRECGVGSRSDDTLRWRIPLVTDDYVLRGVSFDETVGTGVASAGTPSGEFVITTQDRNAIGGLTMPS